MFVLYEAREDRSAVKNKTNSAEKRLDWHTDRTQPKVHSSHNRQNWKGHIIIKYLFSLSKWLPRSFSYLVMLMRFPSRVQSNKEIIIFMINLPVNID